MMSNLKPTFGSNLGGRVKIFFRPHKPASIKYSILNDTYSYMPNFTFVSSKSFDF
jgi:hypothetical protein